MKKTLEHLSGQQQTALLLLARGDRIEDVARLAGVAERTIYRWRDKHPEFREAIASIITSMCDIALHDMIEGARESIRTLKRIAENDASEDKDRIAASKALLDGFGKLMDMRREQAREAAQAQQQPQPAPPEWEPTADDLEALEAELARRQGEP